MAQSRPTATGDEEQGGCGTTGSTERCKLICCSQLRRIHGLSVSLNRMSKCTTSANKFTSLAPEGQISILIRFISALETGSIRYSGMAKL